MNILTVSKGGAAKAGVMATIIALLAFTSGCLSLKPAKAETHHYLLTSPNHVAPTTNSIHALSNCVVRLRPVEIANYLKTRDIAVRTGTNEVTFEEFQRWAEPLDAGIRRVLAEDLANAHGIRAVLTDQSAPEDSPVYNLTIHVLACEGTQMNYQGSVRFKASWQITRSGGMGEAETVVDRGEFLAQPSDWQPGDFNQLARQLSNALNHFSSVLTDAISKPH